MVLDKVSTRFELVRGNLRHHEACGFDVISPTHFGGVENSLLIPISYDTIMGTESQEKVSGFALFIWFSHAIRCDVNIFTASA